MDMIEENVLTTTKVEEDIDVGYEVVVANVAWSSKPFRAMKKEGELPTQISMTIPENVLKQANKPANVFNDIIESYVYNTLTRKFGHEVWRCQIWLPLDK